MVWGQVGMGRSVEFSSPVNLILIIELQYADHSTDLYMYQFVCCVCVCVYMYVYVWDCVTACVEQVSFSVVQTRMG